MEPLTIGQIARRTGVGVETVRFYEKQGLIAEPPRRPSGYRQYPVSAVRRIRFIKRAKELGFSLREIKEILLLRVDPTSTCADVRTRAESKITDIEDKIRALERMKVALARLVGSCHDSGPTGDCPILEAMDREEDDRD